MGDINLAAGKLAEAESYYLEAQKQDRAFLGDGDLIKAATARLLTGDVAAADRLAEQYFAARSDAKDPMLEYRRSQWAWIAGHRRAAMQQMEAFARASEQTPAMRDAASRAWSDLALCALMLGDRNAAAQLAQNALSAASQASAGNAVVSRFLAMPEATSTE